MKRSYPANDNSENVLLTAAKKSWIKPIEDNPFSFPFNPYPTQLRLMNDMNAILQNRGIGIFESPTGTGKTL